MKKLIICNFKMNNVDKIIFHYKKYVFNNISLNNSQEAKLVFCPAFPYLQCMQNIPQIALGAQDCSRFVEKSSTGEVSAEILQEMNCEFVILGHSERRLKLSEDSSIINKKILNALQSNLKIILCVGDINRDHNNESDAIDFVLDQCASNLNGVERSLWNNFIIAYEPVWAIGSGIIPELSVIKKMLSSLRYNFPECSICYGGSVNSANAHDILQFADGLLIGKACLDYTEIMKILSYANQ